MQTCLEHACSIADRLGINRILIHKWSSLLSAYGISQSQLQYETSEPFAGEFSMDALPAIRERIKGLKSVVEKALLDQGAKLNSIQLEESLSLRFFGTDTNIVVSRPADEDYGAAFVADHLREFAFVLERNIVIDSIHVRGTGSASVPAIKEKSPLRDLENIVKSPSRAVVEATGSGKLYVDGAWRDAPIYRLEKLPHGSSMNGPCLLLDETQTILVEPQFRTYILPNHVVIDKIEQENKVERHTGDEIPDDDAISPIQLSVFAHRFMSIAEQMGNTLQRTAISTSIRERLDFSCAIFSPDGQLVANAPHIPIHLGSMQLAIQAQHHEWRGRLQPGDVLMTNHPEWGGTHLPDITIVTPVFVDSDIAFYTASRGHHTDIGE